MRKLKLNKTNALLLLATIVGLGSATKSQATGTTLGATSPGPAPDPAPGPLTGPGPGPRYLTDTKITSGSTDIFVTIPRDPDGDPGPMPTATGGLPTWLSNHPAANQPVYTGRSPIIAQEQIRTLTRDQIKEFDIWKATTTGLKAGSNVEPTDPNAPPPAWWIPTYL